MEVLFYLYNFTAMSHRAVHSAQRQKMRSLVGMPVLQVVQHVRSLEQLWVERIYCLTFMDTVDENTEDNYLCMQPCHLQNITKKIIYFPKQARYNSA